MMMMVVIRMHVVWHVNYNVFTAKMKERASKSKQKRKIINFN